MPSNRTNSASTPGWALITLATVAAMAVIAVLLLGVMTAQAQNDKGAVPNLRLSSPSAGQLTISWDAPEPARRTTGLSGPNRTWTSPRTKPPMRPTGGMNTRAEPKHQSP